MDRPARKSEIAERLFHRLYPVLGTKSSVGDIMATAALLADMLMAMDNGGSPYGHVTQSSDIPRVYVEGIRDEFVTYGMGYEGSKRIQAAIERALGHST